MKHVMSNMLLSNMAVVMEHSSPVLGLQVVRYM